MSFSCHSVRVFIVLSPRYTHRGGYRKSGRGGVRHRGRVRAGDVPPPARSAEAFGGPALSDTDYLSILLSLKLGRKTKKWRQIMVGGGGGGGNRTYLSAFHI